MCPYLELICVVEVHAHGGHHPGLEERGQDLLGDGVGNEVKVQRVPPVGRERKESQEGPFGLRMPATKNTATNS